MESIVWSGFFRHSDGTEDDTTNAFGEFVTLTQQGTIRGCMGWWDDGFTAMSGHDLSSHFAESLGQAMNVDDRSVRFRGTDLYSDPTSQLDFQAMLLPIRGVTPSFSNERQGIILAQQNGNKRATFLPGVFVGTESTLENVLPRLVHKAGNPIDYKLVMYKTRSISWDAVDTLKKARPYLRDLCRTIVDSIMGAMRRSGQRRMMPYILRPHQTQWESDDSQHVRNLSCIRLMEAVLDEPLLTQQMRKRAHGDAHAMVYVSPEGVDYEALDDEFGRPQLLIALPSRFRRMIHRIPIPWDLIKESIFAWNWWAQVISLYRLDAYYQRLVDTVARFTPIETNEVAVLFEGSAALYTVFPAIQSVCIRSLQELGRRRRHDFYMFSDGTCRMDITCHVLNGLLYITRKKNPLRRKAHVRHHTNTRPPKDHDHKL